MGQLSLLLAFHNHQPQGNFGEVFEKAYADCYRPLVEAIYDFPKVRVALHHTGPLLEWLESQRPEYLRTLRSLVERGQVEVLGGGFYEPMLAVLPERDAVGQLEMMNDWCHERLGARPTGMWLAERVWEPDLPRVIAQAGLRFTMLDDTHFRNAGVMGDLRGYSVTEKAGAPIGIFPIDKELRYAIPFLTADKAMALLEGMADRWAGETAVTYGDDGEKFGVWPGTKEWVWGEGWMRKFLALLSERTDKVRTGSFAEGMDKAPPAGAGYLPPPAHEELGEWSLPAASQEALHHAREAIEKAKLTETAGQFLRGGIWQGFLGKYEESNRMHKKMLRVSARVASAERAVGRAGVGEARRELYRGQCNCAYWHGLFGGLYLGALRHAVYKHLLDAEVLADQALGTPAGYEVSVVDADADFRNEVLVEGEPLDAYFKPELGGTLYELDFKPRRWNVLNVLGRRAEGYHEKLRKAAQGGQDHHESGGPVSIHDLVKLKEPGLDRLLVYDRAPRLGFVDHFLPAGTTLSDVERGTYEELGDFTRGAYVVERVDGGAERRPAVSVHLFRVGTVAGRRVRVDKQFRVEGARVACTYRIALESGSPLEVVFAPELALFVDTEAERAQKPRALPATSRLELQQDWLAAAALVELAPAAPVWQHAIEAASQSEGGFERTYQGTSVWPRFSLPLEAGRTSEVHVALALAER